MNTESCGIAVKIPISGGHFATVDAEDFERISAFKWKASVRVKKDGTIAKVYAQRSRRDGGSPMMHRSIIEYNGPMQVDHINGDGLDNRRCNLRLCSRSENMANQEIGIGNTSGRKGVTWHKRDAVWQAQLKVNGKMLYLGSFPDLDQAKAAYDRAAREAFGQFWRAT